MNIGEKVHNLKNYFLQQGNVAVAFSGGVDSCLLLKIASEVLGKNVIALIASLKSFQNSELLQAESFCKENSIKYHILEFNELELADFVNNPSDRCYHCKKFFMSGLATYAKDLSYDLLCDGTNADDDNDYRPGAKALSELGVTSPLKIFGFSKSEIRTIAKELGIPQWNKPSLPCLATRIPYGDMITKEKLNMIDISESYLHSLGFSQLRVRVHENIARIELSDDDFDKLFNSDLRFNISSKFIEFGFDYVSVDLIGYKNGSMNKVLNYEQKTNS